MDRSRVLLIGAAEPLRRAFHVEAQRRGIEVRLAGAQLAPPADGSEPDLCVLALQNGPELRDRIRAVRKVAPSCPLIALVSGGDVETGVELVREGAADAIASPAEPAAVVARALALLAPPPAGPLCDLAGRSPAMRTLRGGIQEVAPALSTVLITGETGTGKGLVARTLHRMSRPEAPFVHVDCSVLSPSVIESELFGHERGAFTGASARKRGRFELAEQGTVFLDEIGELMPSLQAKLLRVIHDCEYERVGGTRALPMRARVLAATNVDLERAVVEGRFRADLYYRLNVVRLRVPPLRERLDDLPELVEEGLARTARRLGLPLSAVSDELCDRLSRHLWPGNVRELLNVLERMFITRPGARLGPLDADAALSELVLSIPLVAAEVPAAGYGVSSTGPPSFEASMPARAAGSGPGAKAPADRHRIASSLIQARGNVSRAARALGIPRSTLRYRIARYDLGDLIPRD